MKAERIAKGISLSEMAEKLEMTPGTYSKRNGHIRINVDDLAKVIEVLELPQDKCGIFYTCSFQNVNKSTPNNLIRRTNNARFKTN